MRSLRWAFRVPREHINYLRSTVESYGGLAMVRTLDPRIALVEILIAPGCEHWVRGIIESLSSDERLCMERVTEACQDYLP